MVARYLIAFAAPVIALLAQRTAPAQSTRALPYSAQLKTDPAVGNVQGIQRYGRPLKTDPDEGEGFSYHVYPVVEQPQATAAVLTGQNPSNVRQAQLLQAGVNPVTVGLHAATTASASEPLPAPTDDPAQQTLPEMREAHADLQAKVQEGAATNEQQTELANLQAKIQIREQVEAALQSVGIVPAAAAGGVNASLIYQSPGYSVGPAEPFDWTSGIRSFPPTVAPDVPGNLVPDDTLQMQPFSEGFFAQTGGDPKEGIPPGPALLDIYHQPLIQIKLRVIEVVRNDALAVNSVLEYVSRENADPSLTSGRPLNNEGDDGFENARGLSRFPLPGLISDAVTGTGLLVNLTGEHINWVAAFLATEFNADLVTAPEVVTLNGQNVEFVAGAKLPFALGQNVIQGTNNNIQQVFFKHVGTMVSVTPSIVNWGYHGEGRGEAAIAASEVQDWGVLIYWMRQNTHINTASLGTYKLDDYSAFPGNPNPLIPPFDLQTLVLQDLNKFNRSDLLARGVPIAEPVGECDPCRWKPEDCTIDLSLVVRLSEAGTDDIEINAGEETTLGTTNVEENVRAIANVIQVKSGHGVVMAGLIGEREIEDSAKIPLIGDLPLVGWLFRSKTTERQKTEVLIFVEAAVLPPDPACARAQSGSDFALSQPFISGDVLDNPLELGMYRVGFGTYLPPHTCGEEIFWIRFGRTLRKMRTHIDDTLGE